MSTASGPTDEEAIASTLAGDADAFRTLVERYQGRIFRLALRVLREEEAARDATQDAFLKAFRSLAKFQGRSSFYTWLYRLAMNQCLDVKRRDKSGGQVEWTEGGAVEQESSQPATPEVAGVSFGPAASVMRKQLREKIAAAIETLPDNARETLLLREVEGLSYAEIGKALSIPKGTVMSRLHYARKQLQTLLAEAGISPGAEAGISPGAEAGISPGAEGAES